MKVNKEFILAGLRKFGINLDLQINKSERGIELTLIPEDLEVTNGFRIHSLVGWRTVKSNIIFGTYSLPLLQTLQRGETEKKILGAAFLKAALKQGYELKFEINKSFINVHEINEWPQEWENFNIELSCKPFDTENEDIVNDVILFQQEIILGFIVSFLELKEVFIDNESRSTDEFEKLPEGAKTTVVVNRYERSIKNRSACINYFGLTCQVCGFDFEKIYGALGKGFIHVHHITPVSELGENYFIDPITDLLPVCPNCHYMLHKENPPIKAEDLKSLLLDN